MPNPIWWEGRESEPWSPRWGIRSRLAESSSTCLSAHCGSMLYGVKRGPVFRTVAEKKKTYGILCSNSLPVTWKLFESSRTESIQRIKYTDFWFAIREYKIFTHLYIYIFRCLHFIFEQYTLSYLLLRCVWNYMHIIALDARALLLSYRINSTDTKKRPTNGKPWTELRCQSLMCARTTIHRCFLQQLLPVCKYMQD